jgi:Mrp family chromosome partitioning ATPase
MGALLDRLRARWDLVILDAPPLLPVTDASVLAARVDGVLLLARHGSTKEDELDAAVDALERVDATILGLVLNLVPPGQTAYGTYGDSAAGPAPEPHPA